MQSESAQPACISLRERIVPVPMAQNRDEIDNSEVAVSALEYLKDSIDRRSVDDAMRKLAQF
jgi:hypothetical protein